MHTFKQDDLVILTNTRDFIGEDYENSIFHMDPNRGLSDLVIGKIDNLWYEYGLANALHVHVYGVLVGTQYVNHTLFICKNNMRHVTQEEKAMIALAGIFND